MCHLAGIPISQMIKYFCGILASELLGSGRFAPSLVKWQGTYRSPRGCFTVGFSALFHWEGSADKPQCFPVSLLPPGSVCGRMLAQ